MRIGMMIGEGAGESPPMDEVIQRAQRAEAAGLHSAWLAHAFSHDAISLLGLVGRETSRIELGTAVVPTYPRHPVVMAQQALTTQAASKGRFTLGIGLSHKFVMKTCMVWPIPATSATCASTWRSCGRCSTASRLTTRARSTGSRRNISVQGTSPVPVVLAALGPKMLDFAGRESAGTVTWMAGHKALREHVVPRITAAAKAAERPAPRVIAGMPLAITDDPAQALEVAAKVFAIYNQLPAYRTMLDRGGLNQPPEVALLGDAATVSGELKRLEDVGVTDLCAFVFQADAGAFERTVDFLGSLC